MNENINFNKPVFNKNAYGKVIDTSFKQLGAPSIQQQLDVQPTVNEFFAMYNELFYNIPEMGTTDSHEYLIKKSSDYILFNPNNEEITALQNEITQLRTDLLNAQKQIVELHTGTTLANPQ